jgi:hypothetical protein
MTEPSLHHIPDKAAIRTGAGCVHPQTRFSLFEKGVELPLSDAGFDGNVCEFFIELDDTIQAAEIEDGAVVGRGNTRPISPVLSAADWIERDPVLVGNLNTPLEFILIAGSNERDYLLLSRECCCFRFCPRFLTNVNEIPSYQARPLSERGCQLVE